MIVVDTNVLAYLLIPGRHTEAATRLFMRDPAWAAPLLWRSELRNVLATYVRAGHLALIDALSLDAKAAEIMGPHQHQVDSSQVLRLAQSSRCSAYDCEYIALAEFLDVPMVTADSKLLKAFEGRAVGL